MLMSPLFAVSALEKAQNVPQQFWVKVIVFFVAVLLVVFVVKLAGKVNKLILFLCLGIFCFLVGFNWIYQRNEPAFATPVVEFLAQFFPTKGAYEIQKEADPLNAPAKKPGKPMAQPAKSAPSTQPAKK